MQKINGYIHISKLNKLHTSNKYSLFHVSSGSDSKESVCNAEDPDLIPLQKGMASHYSILAWRVLWTEEPGRLQTTVHRVQET